MSSRVDVIKKILEAQEEIRTIKEQRTTIRQERDAAREENEELNQGISKELAKLKARAHLLRIIQALGKQIEKDFGKSYATTFEELSKLDDDLEGYHEIGSDEFAAEDLSTMLEWFKQLQGEFRLRAATRAEGGDLGSS